MNPPALPSQIPSLNGLRACSILLVLVAHVAGTRGAPTVLDRFGHVGNLGVKVFFVISGFLITTLLLREMAATGGVSLRAFYRRRTLRIFPAFYAYVLIVVILAGAGVFSMTQADLVHAVTYTSNYHIDTFKHTDSPLWSWEFNHLWSLAVEEQFYLIWPCLFVLLGPRRALAVAAVVLVVCPICRWVMWYELDATRTAMSRRSQAVADALATGCLLAAAYNRLGRWRAYTRFAASPFALPMALCGILAALGTAVISKGAYYVFGQTCANIAIAALIDLSVRHPDSTAGRLLNWRPVTAVGMLSYSLYLWQEPFLNPMNELPAYTGFPQNIGLAVVAAVLSFYLIERPFLKLKARQPHSLDGKEATNVPG